MGEKPILTVLKAEGHSADTGAGKSVFNLFTINVNMPKYKNIVGNRITILEDKDKSQHNTALIPNKFTRCAYNIQKRSLGINSLTLTGVMIPVGVNMLIFVH
jgi:hypothetical protein